MFLLFDGQPRWDQFSRVNETLNVTNTGHPRQWFIHWWWIRLGMATEGVLSPLLNPKQASCTARDPRILRSGLMNLAGLTNWRANKINKKTRAFQIVSLGYNLEMLCLVFHVGPTVYGRSINLVHGGHQQNRRGLQSFRKVFSQKSHPNTGRVPRNHGGI